MEWNKVYYIDCMDKERGLPSLEDKSVDLCLTDIPYNRKYDGALLSDPKKTDAKPGCYDNKIFFDDFIEDYPNWIQNWFDEIMRVCTRMIITPGRPNLCLWTKIEEPMETFVHYKKNSTSQRSMVRFSRWEPILLYGKWKHQFDFVTDVFDIPLKSGFLGDDKKLVHPTPKTFKLWLELIKQSKF